MDKGAHFYRCDFQVHSPRDINWNGKKHGVNPEVLETLTPDLQKQITEERIQFAKEYLDKARKAGINALAITDHHDIVSVKIIRKVSKEENQQFRAKGEFEKIITVFPGIELTLTNPASQCLLIFDSDFTDANLDSIIHFLGITPTSEFLKNTVETRRISQKIIPDLVSFYKELEELPYCKGRFIILPHVGNGSQHSILRQGFQEHYVTMPCFGGYCDKAISDEAGYQNKINGGDVNYGNKSIAIFSTSDNRYEDGREFGHHATWVKWAEPTAEAIRQACLAKESRISQEEPELPQIFIRQIDVTTSKFLGTFNINLNKQYNAFIGGRGTGKSTILEYLRWGLCDQTVQNIDFEEMSVIAKRRDVLIQKTLAELGGEVRVTMEKNGILHIVKRSSATKEIFLKIGENEFQQVKEEDIRKLLTIQSYSQKQLSDVGVKTEELKRFIEQPIIGHLETLRFQLNEVGVKLKNSYSQLIRKKGIEQEIEKFNLESQSLNVQINNTRNSLKGISEQDQEIINKKSKYEIEEKLVNSATNLLAIYESQVSNLDRSLEEISPEPLEASNQIENAELVKNIFSEVELKFHEFRDAIKSLKNIFNVDSLSKLNSYLKEWRIKKEEFDVAYELAKKKAFSSQQQLDEIHKIEERIKEINNFVSERKLILKGIGNPELEFLTLRQNWERLHAEKTKMLNEQAIKFTDLSKNLIKAEVTKNIDLLPFRGMMKAISEGTRIREERIDALLERIRKSESPIKEYSAVIEELRLLAELKISEDKTFKLPTTPILTSSGYTEDQKAKLSSRINSESWVMMLASELEFIPEFYYRTNNQLGDVIPFSAASAGQQATALLTVLLNQPGIPLLIDQPEDDIDNKAIDQIIKNIWDAKRKRQLIFTSHNANLVVNGDAELVVCCDYKDSSSQTRGIIKVEGAIDTQSVKNEITSVMEGGERAFKLRKDKYGF